MTSTPIRVLLLEDNPGDARLVQAAFAGYAPRKFAVTCVERLADALARLGAEPFDAMLCDLSVPDSTGMATPRAIIERFPALPLVVLTGSHDESIGRDAIQHGAQDYLVKGKSDADAIVRCLHYAIERKQLELQLHMANRSLGDLNEQLEAKVLEKSAALAREITERAQLETRMERDRRASAEQLQQTYLDTIEAIALALQKRSVNTSGGQRRASALAVAMARAMGLAEERVEGLRIGGLLFDLGMMTVPADILNRARALTRSEFALIKAHVQSGHDIVRGIRFPWPVAEIIAQHHERLDGSGYPAGLGNGAILLEARILAVADVVQAMCSHRPQRAAFSIDAALEEIGRGRGILYDADAVDACLRLFRQQGFAFSAIA